MILHDIFVFSPNSTWNMILCNIFICSPNSTWNLNACMISGTQKFWISLYMKCFLVFSKKNCFHSVPSDLSWNSWGKWLGRQKHRRASHLFRWGSGEPMACDWFGDFHLLGCEFHLLGQWSNICSNVLPCIMALARSFEIPVENFVQLFWWLNLFWRNTCCMISFYCNGR